MWIQTYNLLNWDFSYPVVKIFKSMLVDDSVVSHLWCERLVEQKFGLESGLDPDFSRQNLSHVRPCMLRLDLGPRYAGLERDLRLCWTQLWQRPHYTSAIQSIRT
jgi:hypothetical protein